MSWFGKKEQKKVWKVKPDEEVVYQVFGSPITDPEEKSLTLEDIKQDNHQQIYDRTLKYFQDTKLYPVQENGKPKEPLSDLEKLWLSKQCILRYLRACSWDYQAAVDRINKTIGWRREFGLSYGKINAELVAEENETGKQQIFGYDKSHRPCLILMTGRQNTAASERQIQHLIYMLECSIDFMPKNQDKLCLCVDFKKYPESCPYESMIPPVGVGKEVLRILQYHYPERLGRAMFINMPMLANVFLKLCWPFVDPYTKQKCKFNEPFADYVDKEMLAYNFGGEANFEYDHDHYWDDFVGHVDKKRNIMMDNYKKLGGGIGLSEVDLREGL